MDFSGLSDFFSGIGSLATDATGAIKPITGLITGTQTAAATAATPAQTATQQQQTTWLICGAVAAGALVLWAMLRK